MTLNIFMDNVESQIKSRVESFVSELSALVKQAALADLANAINKSVGAVAPAAPSVAKAPAAPAAGKKRGPAPAPAKPAPKAAAKAKAAPKAAPAPAAPSASAAAKRKAGQKRSPDEIVKTTEKLLQYITKNSGQRIEEIAKGVGHSTKELTLPVKKLLNDKKITAKGEKRATRYYIAGKAS